MKIYIPEKVKVCGKVYDITYPYNFVDDSVYYGMCRHATLRILLGNKSESGETLPKDIIDETFIHELTHTINHIYLDNKLDENEVGRLSEGLYQVIVDNDFIKGKDK